MEPFDFKAVRATVCNAGEFARPLAICLRIYYSFYVCRLCVCVQGGRRKRDGKRKKEEEEGC